MRWLSRHQTAVLLVSLVVVTWGALWLAYDYRSPVSQFLRGVGTVQLEGWSAYDLDAVCVRLEAANGTPSATADTAIQLARKTYPNGYVREALLVSLHDTCTGGDPTLAWVVAMAWPESAVGPAPSAGSQPRAIVLVDAITGKLMSTHAENLP